MAKTIRQRICEELKTQFQTITTANGYETNVGSKVFLWKSADWQDAEMPGVNLQDMTEEINLVKVGVRTEEHILTFEAFAACSTGTTSVETARKLAGDIVKLLGVARGNYLTVSGTRLCFDINMKSIKIGLDQEKSTRAGAHLTFEVKFRTPYFDAYTANN